MEILLRELTALYDAFSRGLPSPLAPLALQYADYGVWQRGWLQGEPLEQQLAYWRQQLQGAPHALELPTDKPRPALQTYRGAVLSRRFPRALSDALRALPPPRGRDAVHDVPGRLPGAAAPLLGPGRRERGHPHRRPPPAGAGAPDRLLHQHPGAARPLHPRASPSASSSPRCARRALGAFAHQDVPFEKLVEALQPERDLSRSPLFQVMIVLQQDLPLAPRAARPRRCARWRWRATPRASTSRWRSRTPATASKSRSNTTPTCSSPAPPSGLLEHFEVLLEGVAAAPDARVSALPLLAAAERQRVLVDWNATARRLPARRVPAHAVRGAGGARAGRRGRLLRGPAPHVPGARRARQPARPPPARRWAWARTRWWRSAVERSLEMVVGLLASSRPAAPTCRSTRRTRRSAWPSCSTTRPRAGAPHPGAPARPRCPPPARVVRLDADWARDRPRARDATRATRRRPGEPGLRHLHLGLHRPAQGRHEYARRHLQPAPLDAGGVRPDARGPRAPEDAVQLRRLRLGVLLAAADRRPVGGGASRWPPGRRLPGPADRASRASPRCTSSPRCSRCSSISRAWRRAQASPAWCAAARRCRRSCSAAVWSD